MSIADNTENNLLKLIFNATAWANMAQNGVTPHTNIAVGLHTADPTDSGSATTSEIAYTGYLRKNVVRTTLGWTVTNDTVTPAANIDFDVGTAGTTPTATFFSTSKSNAAPPTGAQDILWSGAISPTVLCGNGVIPRLTTATVQTLG